MDQGRQTPRAAAQGLSVVLAAGFAAVAGWNSNAGALDAQRLHVHVAQLAAFANDGRQLAREGALAPESAPHVQDDARRLAVVFETSLDELRRAPVQPALAHERERALGAAGIALEEIRREAEGGVAGPRLDVAATRLATQAEGLRDAMP